MLEYVSHFRTVTIGGLLVAVAVGGQAQDPEPHSARAYCLKVAGDDAAEFESLVRDVGIPAEKGRVGTGDVKGFDLLRAVVPLGSSARCDYIAVFRYGLLPEELPGEGLEEAMKRAGVEMSAQQAMEKWNALSELVSLQWWWFAERVGPDWPEGTYVNMNFWTIRPNGFLDYLAVERRFWKPIAEEYVASGRKITWDLVGLWAPQSAEGPHGMTFNAYHDWEAMMSAQSWLEGTWSKVQPGLDFDLVEELKQKVRTPSRSEIYRLIATTTE